MSRRPSLAAPFRVALTVAVCAWFVAAAQAQVIFHDDFSNTNIQARYHNHGGCYAYSTDVLNAPGSGGGNKAVRFWNKNWEDNSNCTGTWQNTDVFRNELRPLPTSSVSRVNDQEEFWFGYRTYFDDIGHLGGMMHAQVIGAPWNGTDLAIRLESNNRIRAYVRMATANQKYSEHIFTYQENRWYDVVVRYKKSTTGSGRCQIWIDGNRVFNYSGRTAQSTQHAMFKFGQYNRTRINDEYITWFDDFRIAKGTNQRQNVDPAQNGSPPSNPGNPGNPGSPGNPGDAFTESGGQVVMEAEHAHASRRRSDPSGSWSTDNSINGAVGGSYVEAPQAGFANWSDGAELSFDIDFSTTGTYHVWVRRNAQNGGSNSTWFGSNGGQRSGNDNNNNDFNTWAWKKLGTLNVNSSGVRSLDLRRREKRYRIDRIILRKSSSTPTGNGPAESPRGGSNPGAGSPGGGPRFVESGGMVVMEAESYTAKARRGDVDHWTSRSGGASIGGYMEAANPAPQATWSNGAQLSYRIDFQTTGNYKVWVRRYAHNGGTNSTWFGANGSQSSGNDNQGNYDVWRWVQLGSINVSNSGIRTFELRRRERRYRIDRIVITKGSGTPSGSGPAESQRIP